MRKLIKTTSVFLFLSLLLFISGCSDENNLEDPSSTQQQEHNEFSGIREFSSKEALSSYVKNPLKMRNAGFESAQDSALIDPEIEFIVPDQDFREVLSKNLCVIVNDTIYKITREGTFYTHKKYFSELENALKNIIAFEDISVREKRLGNVYLFDTHDIWNNSEPNPITDPDFFDDDDDELFADEQEADEMSMTRAVAAHRDLTDADVNAFPQMGLVKPNIIGRFLEFAFNKTTYNKYRFKSNKNRKLYVSFYNKDFVAYRTIGFDVKVMKKLWHGMKWGRMQNWPAGVYSGFSKIRIEHKINPPKTGDMNAFFNELRNYREKEFNNRLYSDFYYAIDQRKGLFYNSFPITNDKGHGGVSIPILVNLLGDKNISTINKQIEKGLFQGLKYLQKTYYSANKKTGAYTAFDESNKNVYYTTYMNMLYFNGGGYRVRDTFLKERRNIEIPFTLKSGSNIKPGMPKFGSGEIVSSKVIAADGIVYTEDGDGWIGVRICFGN